MKYKKLLFTILVIVTVMLVLMLATSYAWYSFSTGATTFDAVTSNKDVDIRFIKGEFINDTVAVPIQSSDVDQYSDKHQFIVRTKNNRSDNQILLKISLEDVAIDDALKVSAFKVELYHQGSLVSTVTGSDLGINGAKIKDLKTVTLDNDVDNNFELRVYLLDNNEDQSSLMNKNFSCKIKTEIFSRLKTNVSDYSDTDINVSSITVDGKSSQSIPTDGYYTMSSTCTKGSSLTWDGYSKTITYGKGSKVGDSCSLVFTSATSSKLLNTVEVGSYVKYTGNNGCDGNHCSGDNANYVNDDDMGYCYGNSQGFTVNGWRIAYIQNGSAYLVSAGAPECMCTDSSGNAGTSCSNYETTKGVPKHFANLNQVALKYCNSKYSYNGVCDSTSSWSISDNDYQMITTNIGTKKALSGCSGTYGSRACGFNYNLINNGGYYWFATPVSSSSSLAFNWVPNYRRVDYGHSDVAYGVRPVLRLRSSVSVIGGSGTYEDPYVIQ